MLGLSSPTPHRGAFDRREVPHLREGKVAVDESHRAYAGQGEKLIEMRPGGVEASGISIKSLPLKKRLELEELKKIIEEEATKDG